MDAAWPLSEFEQEVYELSLRMNERGIPLDIPLVKKTLSFLKGYTEKRMAECRVLTGGINPTQVGELLKWLQREGARVSSLQRVELEHIVKTEKLPENVAEVIKIRLEQGRVSTKKLVKMVQMDSGDAMARGVFVYHGASTGRYTAKRLQAHNFQRPTIKDVDTVIQWLRAGKFARIVAKYQERTLEAIGSCMRGFIKAPPGMRLLVADYNAIEARVLAWLAGQEDLVLLFHEGKDVYCDMGGYIFGEDPDVVLAGHKAGEMKWSEIRKLGKDTVLGCGFNMGVNKFLLQMEGKGATTINGVLLRRKPEDRGESGKESFTEGAWRLASDAVYGYRRRYEKIPKLWELVEKAAKLAIGNPKKTYTLRGGLIKFKMLDGALVMRLPSGRKIFYQQAEIRERTNPWSGKLEDVIYFRYVNSKGLWVWEQTYGGKLVENAVQAIARDLMVNGMLLAEKAGYAVFGTVHDEIMALVKKVRAMHRMVSKFEKLICQLPSWAKHRRLEETIPLAAEGYFAMRYHK